MKQHDRLFVYQTLSETSLVPVFYHGDFETAKQITAACLEGGAGLIEFTNRGPKALEVFSGLKKEFPDAILGIGSIVDSATAALYIAAGASFVVGPCMDEETAVLCNKRKIAYMPGCATVTEIHKAHALGLEVCKLFPGGEVGGPAFVKAVLGPIPQAKLMPTGGVSPSVESLEAWFKAGITACGMGSQLISKEIIREGDFSKLRLQVEKAMSTIADIKAKKSK